MRRALGARARRRWKLAVVVSCVMLLCGCGPGGFSGLYNFPLPGGADVGDHPYTLKAEFNNVLNLVPQAMVKSDNVPVGKVDSVELERDNRTALVTMTVNGHTSLPANATASLRQSSLLGEKYVELSAPKGKAAGRLENGARIPEGRTNRNADVEEVLGALSLLLNNGGIERLQGITRELNSAFGGREPELRVTLHRVRDLVGQLNAQRSDIIRAIDGVDKLSANMADQRARIAKGLDTIGPGIETANKQRGQLVTMLNSLHKLSDVATGTIRQSKDDMLEDLRSLAPTLRQLAKSGTDIPKSLQILLSYPFSNHAMTALKGDYGNADFDLDFRLDKVLATLGRSKKPLLPLERLQGGQDKQQPPAGGADQDNPGAGSGGGSGGAGDGAAAGGNGDAGGQNQQPSTGSGGGLGGVFGTLLGGGA